MTKTGIFIVFFILGFLVVSTLTKVLSSPKRDEIKVKGEQTKSLTEIYVATPTPTPAPTATPTPIPTIMVTPAPTFTARPVIVLLADLEELFDKYSNAYSVDKELLKRIAQCESSLNPNAQTKDYAGLFQFGADIWVQTRNLMGQNPDLNLRLNAEEAIRTAAFMISQNHLSIWPNCSK